MIFDMRGMHLGDVLLAAPAMREGDSVIIAPRYRVPGLPVEWLDAGRGVCARTRSGQHMTAAWLDVSRRDPVRHGLLAPVDRQLIVVAPAVESPAKRWGGWEVLRPHLPRAVWVSAGLARSAWMRLLNAAHTVICPDTGTAHMADALCVPRVIALHGQGREHFQQYAPYWDRSHCVVRDSMDEILMDDVIGAAYG